MGGRIAKMVITGVLEIGIDPAQLIDCCVLMIVRGGRDLGRG